MSNRRYKEQLWNENPYCHWCNRLTVLTNISHGTLPANAATIDHVFSRLNLIRWVKRKPGEVRQVLACNECNHRRSVEESSTLTREELIQRSRGFTINPKGRPRIIKTLDTLEEVIQCLKEKGVDIQQTCDTVII